MKQILTLSQKAADRIKEIMSKDENNSIGLRVGVKSGGCAGMSYVMEYTKEINPEIHKQIICNNVNCFTKYDENCIPELDNSILL